MALTALQREICRLIAGNRVASGESSVAGGAALNELLSAPRVSRDLDLFHDTAEALAATWEADRRLLREAGFELQPSLDPRTAARTARYSADEVASLEFEGTAPDAGVLARRWRALLEAAERVVQALPAEKAGRCVLRREGGLCAASPEALPSQLARGDLVFHEGSIRGALPHLMAGG